MMLEGILAYWSQEQVQFIRCIPILLWLMHGLLFGIMGIALASRKLVKDGLAILVTVMAAFFIPANLPQKDFLTALCVIIGYVFIVHGYVKIRRAKAVPG